MKASHKYIFDIFFDILKPFFFVGIKIFPVKVEQSAITENVWMDQGSIKRLFYIFSDGWMDYFHKFSIRVDVLKLKF